MATYDYLKPVEAVARAQEGARDSEKITGLRGTDADRFMGPEERTRAGYLRKPSDSWRAHGYLRYFREIVSVQWAGGDGDPGTAVVKYADGATEFIGEKDLLCVERPV